MPGQIKINNKVLNAGIRAYNLKAQMLRNTFEKYENTPTHDISGKPVDGRDIETLAMLIDFEGDTPEKIQKNMDKTVKDMYTAFLKRDMNKISKYLDLMYDGMSQSNNYFVAGINTSEDFVRFSSLARLNQAMVTKQLEYPEYIQNKFEANHRRVDLNASMFNSDAVMKEVAIIKMSHPEFGIGDDICRPFQFNPPIPVTYYYNALSNGFSKASILNNNIVPITIPDSIRNYLKTTPMVDDRTDIIGHLGRMCSIPSTISIGTDNKGSTRKFDYKGLAFIDGRNVVEIAQEELLKLPEYSDGVNKISDLALCNTCDNLVNKALSERNKVVSFAIPRYSQDGSLEVDVKKIKPTAKKYSWIREHLFNWGPFKITTQKDIDNMYKNSSFINDQNIADKAKSYFKDYVDQQNEVVAKKEREASPKAKEHLLNATLNSIQSAKEMLAKLEGDSNDFNKQLKDDLDDGLLIDLSKPQSPERSKQKEISLDD